MFVKRCSLRSCALLLLLVSLSVVFGCNADSKKRLVFLTNAYSPFWDAAKAGWNEAAKELNLAEAGLTADFIINQGGKQGQIDNLRQFYSQSDIVGVALSVNDSEALGIAERLRDLQQRGVHVITVDADVDRKRDRDARSYYIGTDNIQGGRELGVATKNLLEARQVKSGDFVQFVGIPGSQNAIERMQGVVETIGKAYREVDRMGDGVDTTRAKENVRNAIINHKRLVALIGIWSYNGPAICDVVSEKGVRDKMTVVTFDAEPRAVAEMQKGNLDVMVVQNPFQMGHKALTVLKAMVDNDEATIQRLFPNDGKPDGDLLDTGLKVVVPDESSPLKKEMFQPGTEFMTLKTFKEWLDEYGLKGS